MERISDILSPYLFVGTEGVLVEGVRRIIRWQEGEVELAAFGKRVRILGKRLRIEYRSLDSLLISGRVSSLSLSERKE